MNSMMMTMAKPKTNMMTSMKVKEMAMDIMMSLMAGLKPADAPDSLALYSPVGRPAA